MTVNFWYRKPQTAKGSGRAYARVFVQTEKGKTDSGDFDLGLPCTRSEFDSPKFKAKLAAKENDLRQIRLMLFLSNNGIEPTAKEIKQAFLEQKKQRNTLITTQHITLLDLCEQFLSAKTRKKATQKTYFYTIKTLSDFLAKEKQTKILAKDFTVPLCQKYLNYLSETPCHTRNERLTKLKTIFNYGVMVGLIQKNPIQALKRDTIQPEPVYLTAEELERFKNVKLSGNANIAREIFLCLVETGLSLIDFERFEEKWIKQHDGKLYLNAKRQKTGKDFFNIISQNTLETLQKYGGGKMPFTRNNLFYHLKNICLKAGITRISAHKARHTLAAMVIAKTGDLSLVANMLGDSLQTTEKYYGKMTVQGFAKKLENSGW